MIPSDRNTLYFSFVSVFSRQLFHLTGECALDRLFSGGLKLDR
jgi:hypothetical protein